MTKNVIFRVVFLSLSMLLIAGVSHGQATNSSWNGGTGTWNTAGNWTPNTVPNNGGSTYNVTIDSGGSDVVTLNISPTINLLNLGGASGGSAFLEDASGSPETLAITGALTIGATGELLLQYGSTATAASATNAGSIVLQGGSSLTVSGNLSNSNFVGTDYYGGSSTSSLTVTGTFTNNAGAGFYVGANDGSTDVDSVGTLVNNGLLNIGTGATLKLTNQPNGVTDVGAGSHIQLLGTLKAGSNNGLVNLASIEGELQLENGQSLTLTPATLTLSSTGFLDIQANSSVTATNITNSGTVATDYYGGGTTSSLTVTGTFTNNAGAGFYVGANDGSTDVDSVGTLVNNGLLNIGEGATLALTKVGGTSTNTGTIHVGDGSGAGTLKIEGNTTLTGTTGKVILSNYAGNIIGGTGTFTNEKNTIEGSGNIGNGTMGLNNQGTIDADQSVPLIIQASGTVSNSLTMEASAGSILQLDAGSYSQTSTGNILATGTNATVDLESGVAITGGKLTMTGTTADIDLVGTSPTLTLSGVSISGTGALELGDGSTTTLIGTITNTGTVDLNSTGDTTTLNIGANSVILSGTGKIILASNGKGVITGASGGVLHNGNTIEGPGNIGDGVIGVVNTGIIETVAKQTGETEIDAGTLGFSNQGTVEAVASTTIYIDNTANQFLNYNSGTGTLTGGTYIVDGTLNVDGLNITTDAANITVSGTAAKFTNLTTGKSALTNLATIAAGGTLDLISQTFDTVGNFTNNGTLDVGASSKFVVLAADTLTNFSGNTLTGGVYNITGTLEFTGANIVNNDASITLTGTKALIENSTNSANALAGFANNEAGATFDCRTHDGLQLI